MGAKIEGLGNRFDISPVIAPVNLATAANTGLLVSLRDCETVAFVVFKGAGTDTEEPVITVREAKDSSGTDEQDLDVVTRYYFKAEATLDGDESWELATQSAGDVDLVDAGVASEQQIAVIEVSGDQLSDGYTHVTLDIADVGTGAQLGAVLAIRHGLEVQRDPTLIGTGQ